MAMDSIVGGGCICESSAKRETRMHGGDEGVDTYIRRVESMIPHAIIYPR